LHTLGVDGEAYGWAWKPYDWFDPAPRPRDIIHTYIMADGFTAGIDVFFRLDNIPKQAGTNHEAVGRARGTIPQFGPLGGPASRPERANFEATVRGRKCGSRKDHYSPG